MKVTKPEYDRITEEAINMITGGSENYDAVNAFLRLCGKTFYEYLGEGEEIEIDNEDAKGLMSRCMQTLTSKAPNAFMLVFRFFDIFSEKLGI